MADWFNEQGITYVVLKYRLPHDRVNYPKADAQHAMLRIRASAKEWNIDPEKVGIMGASAGGHLASSVATFPDNENMRPNFQVLLYPVITAERDGRMLAAVYGAQVVPASEGLQELILVNGCFEDGVFVDFGEDGGTFEAVE